MHLLIRYLRQDIRKYFRLDSETNVGNIHYTIRVKRGRYNNKQEEFLFEVVNQKTNQIYEVFVKNLTLFV